eukprot:Rmarinus@m.13806
MANLGRAVAVTKAQNRFLDAVRGGSGSSTNFEGDFSSNWTTVQKILKKTAAERTDQDVALLHEYTHNAKFFQALPYEPRLKLCRVMKLQSAESDSKVFCQGDVGDTFYIILTGSVGVFVRKSDGTVTRINTLYAGSGFGERALQHANEARSATVVAREKTDLLVIQKADYDTCIKEYQENGFLSTLEHFEKYEILHTFLSKERIEELAYCAEPRQFPMDAVICRQGVDAEYAFFIARGKVRLTRRVSFQKESKGDRVSQTLDLLLATLGALDIFGALECVTQRPIYTTAVATTAVHVYCVAKYDIYKRLSMPEIRSMKKVFAAHYPSEEEMITKYYTERAWIRYKHKLVSESLEDCELSRSSPSHPAFYQAFRRKRQLPKLSDKSLHRLNRYAAPSSTAALAPGQDSAQQRIEEFAKTLRPTAPSPIQEIITRYRANPRMADAERTFELAMGSPVPTPIMRGSSRRMRGSPSASRLRRGHSLARNASKSIASMRMGSRASERYEAMSEASDAESHRHGTFLAGDSSATDSLADSPERTRRHSRHVSERSSVLSYSDAEADGRMITGVHAGGAVSVEPIIKEGSRTNHVTPNHSNAEFVSLPPIV